MYLSRLFPHPSPVIFWLEVICLGGSYNSLPHPQMHTPALSYLTSSPCLFLVLLW